MEKSREKCPHIQRLEAQRLTTGKTARDEIELEDKIYQKVKKFGFHSLKQ